MNPQQPSEGDPMIQEGIELFLRKQETISIEERRAKWPYYNEHIGHSIKVLLDKLFTTQHPQRVLAGNLSVNTLRTQYFQGVQYLLDKMDDEQGTYRARYNNTRCFTMRNEGYIELHIRYRDKALEASSIVVSDWREKFEEFLQEAKPGEKYHMDMALSDEDITWAKNMLEPLGNMFISKVDKSSILVVRDII
jgi:hypothetical protein